MRLLSNYFLVPTKFLAGSFLSGKNVLRTLFFKADIPICLLGDGKTEGYQNKRTRAFPPPKDWRLYNVTSLFTCLSSEPKKLNWHPRVLFGQTLGLVTSAGLNITKLIMQPLWSIRFLVTLAHVLTTEKH